jgi:aminomethyltransferase
LTALPPLLRRYATDGAPQQQGQLKKTPLYELHVQHGATLVPFGGYSMPVQYSDLSLLNSSLWTREKASIFDVSHMYAELLLRPVPHPLKFAY